MSDNTKILIGWLTVFIVATLLIGYSVPNPEGIGPDELPVAIRMAELKRFATERPAD